MKKLILLAITASVAALVPAAPAHAHGHAHAGEATELVIGWANEPAFAGYPNAVDVHVEHDGRPRADAKLNVVVIFGDAEGTTRSDQMQLDASFGEAGAYDATIIPTSAGTYTFHITGRVAEDKIDITMTSGEDTFDDVAEPTEQQFPEKVPGGIQQRDAIETVQTAVGDAQAAASAANEATATAKTYGIIGIAAGAIAALLALAALAGRWKSTT